MKWLVCPRCSSRFSGQSPRWRCDCGHYLLLESDSLFRLEGLDIKKLGVWRYRESLGVDEATVPVTLGEGSTPLIPVNWEGREVLVKLDYLCPTGSYKDRGSTVMLSKLKAWGLSQIVEDSSGNAGASVAAYAAVAGIQADIYIPESTSSGKALQITLYGAHLVRVPGSREDTSKAAWEAAKLTFYASHNWSPYFLAGMKTTAYEICEQLDWESPDWVVAPVGGGSLLLGLFLGFKDLHQAGIISRIPQLAAIQSDRCAPIVAAWKDGLDEVSPAIPREMVAEGIAVTRPVRGREVLEAIRASDGRAAVVSDEEIWAALEKLGRLGLYVEPTSAVVMAALSNLGRQEVICRDQRVVLVLTGSGLKATDRIEAQWARGLSKG